MGSMTVTNYMKNQADRQNTDGFLLYEGSMRPIQRQLLSSNEDFRKA